MHARKDRRKKKKESRVLRWLRVTALHGGCDSGLMRLICAESSVHRWGFECTQREVSQVSIWSEIQMVDSIGILNLNL